MKTVTKTFSCIIVYRSAGKYFSHEANSKEHFIEIIRSKLPHLVKNELGVYPYRITDIRVVR